jgi:hypothetical protein
VPELVVAVSSSTGDGLEYASGSMDGLVDAVHRLNEAGGRFGWVWDNVTLPRNARISSVTLRVYSNATGPTPHGTFYAQAHDNPPLLSNTVNNISGRTYAAAAVPFAASGWDVNDFYNVGVNLAPLLQTAVDRPGWVSGARFMMQFVGSAACDWQLRTWDSAAARAAQLTISYSDPPAGPPPRALRLGLRPGTRRGA